MTSPLSERPTVRLSGGCWVGRRGDTLLMAAGAEFFVVEDPAAADAIEERLGLDGGRGDSGAEVEALVAIGLLTAAPGGATVTSTQLAEAVLGELLARGMDCEIASRVGARRGARLGSLSGVVDFVTGPTSAPRVAAAVMSAAGAGVGLVTVLRTGSDLVVTPALRPGGRGCGHCLWLRHVATLPCQAAATMAPGHRVVAESLGSWPAELVPVLVLPLADAIQAALRNGAPRVVRLRTGTMSVTRHALLPRPDCPVCGDGRGPGPAAVDGGLAEDPWCGLITSLTDGASVRGLHSVIAAGALPLSADGTPSASAADLSRGLGCEYEAARVRACGEALERYAARSPQFEEVRARPPAGAESLTLAELWPGPAPGVPSPGSQTRQPAYPAIETSELAGWVRATWLDGGDVWVPRPAMVIGGGLPSSVAQVTSNGVAAGPGVGYARLRAVAELLERDAVLTTWVHRRPALRLSVTDRTITSLAAALDDEGVKVSLWLFGSAASVPVVMAVARGDGSSHLALTIGSACDTSVELAATRAMFELAGNVMSSAAEIRDGALTAVAADGVRGIDDHAAYYLNPATGSALDFLFQPSEQATAPDSADREASKPADIFGECLAAGLRIATCDITPPDVAACGFHVVRAVSPDLVPLWFGWHREPMGHPRLRCPCPNRVPHPFR